MLAARAGPRPEEEEEASELGRGGSFAATTSRNSVFERGPAPRFLHGSRLRSANRWLVPSVPRRRTRRGSARAPPPEASRRLRARTVLPARYAWRTILPRGA